MTSQNRKIQLALEWKTERTGKLTLDELRKCEGFSNVSDTEGLVIIENLYMLSLIAFNYEAKK